MSLHRVNSDTLTKLPSTPKYELIPIAASIAPVTRLLKIFSLHYCIDPDKFKKYPELIHKIITSAIFCTIVAFSIYYKVMYFSHVRVELSIRITDSLQLIFDYLQTVVDYCFLYKYGLRDSAEYFNRYIVLDKILRINQYKYVGKRVRKFVVLFVLLWIITSAFDFASLAFPFGYSAAAVYSVSYLFVIVKATTVLDLMSHLLQIRYRTKVMRDMLIGKNQKEEELIEVISDSGTTMQTKTKPLNFETDWFAKCYLSLTEQTSYVNNMYGVRILLHSLTVVIDALKFGNLFFRIIAMLEKKKEYNAMLYFPLIANLLRIFTGGFYLCTLVAQCEYTYRVREDILDVIDHMLVFEKLDDSLSKRLRDVRNLVETRPLEFHLANFFRLDWTFCTSTASVIITYTIILLQSVN